MTLTVVHGVDERETGIASALINTAQQLGAALGLAVLTTVSITAASTRLPDAVTALNEGVTAGDTSLITTAEQALSHGYATGYLAAAVILFVAAAIAALLVNTPGQPPTTAAQR
jgi:hypothetical protein